MAVGVVVTTTTQSSPSDDQRVGSSSYFTLGQAERGPVDKAIEINSMSDFENFFGGRVAYGVLWDDVNVFFQEGGTKAYVTRVVGPSPSVSSLTLVDRAVSPVATLRIDAYGPGAWGQGVTIDVDPGTDSGTFKIIVAYSGIGNTGVETYDNITTPANAVTRLSESAYVRAVNLGSATAAPDNIPALTTATALTSGSDDRNNINTGSYTVALDRFSSGFGSGAVAIPGQPASNVGVSLAAHAKATNRIALTAPSIGQTKAQAITAKTSLSAALTAGGKEYVGFFWPWVKVPDDSGSTRTISPEGFVAAKRAQAHETSGPAQAPAGVYGRATYVADIETPVTKSDIDQLNDVQVSPIALVNNNIALWGWSSLSSDLINYELLTPRDVINFVAVGLDTLFQQYAWRTIDGRGQLFSDMQGAATGFLDLLRAQNQLFELRDGNSNEIDPGYKVDTGPSVNTRTTQQRNEANAAISVRPSPTAKLIRVNIAKVPVLASI